MADQTFRTADRGTSNPASPGSSTSAEAQSAKEQALSAGREFKDKAKEMASSSADTMRHQASDFVDAAKDAASQATDKATDNLKQAVDGQKNAGAEYVGSLADTMRRAAREFDRDLPIAGTYIRRAASQVEVVSDSIRNGNFDDLLRNAQSFARRQPTAFLGMAVLAGFGVVRFLKSSAEASNDSRPDWHSGNVSNIRSRAADAGQRGYRDEFVE